MKSILLLIGLSFIFIQVKSQNISIQDYRRAVSYLPQNAYNKKLFNLHINGIWAKDGSAMAYPIQKDSSRIYYQIDLKTHEKTIWFDQQRLAKVFADSLNQKLELANIQNLEFINKQNIKFNYKSVSYLLNLTNYTLSKNGQSKNEGGMELSPDKKWTAFAENHNLFIKSNITGQIKRLSYQGIKNYEYASYYGWTDMIFGENGEREAHFDLSWSPDSKWIQTYICDLRLARKMYLLDWSKDSLYRPELASYYRGSPGDTTMVYMIPVFFNIETGEEIRFENLKGTHINQTDFYWSAKDNISFAKQTVRGFKEINLIKINLETKKQIRLYRETSTTNIDQFSFWIEEYLNKIIFTSERHGWKQIYTADLNKDIISPVTKGEYYIHAIEYVDTLKSLIYFTAAGKESTQNPYLRKLYSIQLDGKNLQVLSPEEGHHEIAISPDHLFFIDNVSTLDQPTITYLRQLSSGKIIHEISRAELKDYAASFPVSFESLGRDGKTKIYGAMWKPSNFDASKKYPVIDQSYTGPHTNMYPASFSAAIPRNQALAELGFIVVMIDGMGSAGRSKAFHNYSYYNMNNNLTEHVSAIKELGRKYKWIDTTEVGITGHSAGGYDAGHGILAYPDFYKVAVATSADHDFRMEKAWWPEMYMGWPVIDSIYNAVSNITMANQLKGKLLIVHGGLDNNVNPSATFKLSEALVKANKEFDLIILPSQNHGYSGPFNEYIAKKRWNYFVKHLLHQEPIWDFDFKMN